MTRHPELDSQQLNAALDLFATPGLAVAVVKNDELVVARGFGQRALDQPSPVDEHTRFAIGSISKSFTATSLGLFQMKFDQPKLRDVDFAELEFMRVPAPRKPD